MNSQLLLLDNNDEYFLSQSQVAEAVGVQSICILRFLESEHLQSLTGNDFTFYTLPAEGSDKPVKAIPPKVASLFWADQAQKGNSK